ncbi:MAG: HAD-IIIA family hydrolase [Gammaproteobacteria bacterium]|nr:HAD-IIIA family hydrolase [Gammaproteobacteria bacterium]
MDELRRRARAIKLVAFDIDGVMTDGRLYYTDFGNETKAFNVKDGLGIKLLRSTGVEIAIITGRTSELVKKRASDLKISKLVQGREDKIVALKEMMAPMGIQAHEVAYMGDDLPDLSAIRFAGIGVAVADALPIVREHADMVMTRGGGDGAVREFCEWLMAAQGTLDGILDGYMN